jgi:integrase
VPIPAGWRLWLRQWMLYGELLPSTVRTRWRTMRRVLGLGDDVYAKTIRHMVATCMRRAGVPELDIKGQIGHSIGVTSIYAKHRPDYLQASRIAIDALWDEVMEAVHNWLAVRMRCETAKRRCRNRPARGA